MYLDSSLMDKYLDLQVQILLLREFLQELATYPELRCSTRQEIEAILAETKEHK